MGSLASYVTTLDARLGQVNTCAPKVSVIVTNYNYADYIVDCLQSVSRQDYPAIECVVVDDGSTDPSLDRIKQFIDGDRSQVKFKLVTHDTNQGQLAAFYSGFVASEGAFVAFLDADDLLLPDFISAHMRVHLTLPPVAFTSSNQYQIDSTGQVIGGGHPDLQVKQDYRAVGTIALQRSFWVWATTSSMVFRRAVLGCVLVPDCAAEFRKCADNLVAHFCNVLGGSILIPTVLGCYRRHQRNTFSTNPLIGGRLPTGDMRDHPAHGLLLRRIQTRLLEQSRQFIALLGYGGFLHVLVKVTPTASALRVAIAAAEAVGPGLGVLFRFWQLLGFVYLRRLVRFLRGRHPCVTVNNLEGMKRGAKIASYSDYQRHRRDAK